MRDTFKSEFPSFVYCIFSSSENQEKTAPAPLWYVLPVLSSAYPDMTIASSIKSVPAVREDLDSEFCQLAILPYNPQYDHYINIPFLKENLSVCVPASRFLVQTNQFEFEELVRESSLPCFTTNLAKDDQNLLADRIKIPVTDPEANVTYYLACHSRLAAALTSQIPLHNPSTSQ